MDGLPIYPFETLTWWDGQSQPSFRAWEEIASQQKFYEKKIDSHGKKGDWLTKEQDELRAANTALKSNLSTASSNYETLQAELAKLAHEKKDLMIQLENVKKNEKALRDDKNALKITQLLA